MDFSQAGDQCIPSDSWATTNGDCSFAKTTLYDQCIPSPTREASTHYQDHEVIVIHVYPPSCINMVLFNIVIPVIWLQGL